MKAVKFQCNKRQSRVEIAPARKNGYWQNPPRRRSTQLRALAPRNAVIAHWEPQIKTLCAQMSALPNSLNVKVISAYTNGLLTP